MAFNCENFFNMEATNSNISPSQLQRKDEIDNWFSQFIDHLKADHFLLSEGVANRQTSNFYNDLIFGDKTAVVANLRKSSTLYFIENIIKDYLKELNLFTQKPRKLALALSDSKILVWAEIEDEDEQTEDALLIAEAKVNGLYYQHGFYLSSTIIEKSDNLQIPQHYQKIKE